MSQASDRDCVFHWEGGEAEWTSLRVVRADISEGLSAPYELRLTLHAHAESGEMPDPEDLVGKSATLRIRTLTTPEFRSFHGLISEVAELGETRYGMGYEVVVVPPVMRAALRVKSRVFLEKTTKDILKAVLLGDPKMTEDDPEPAHPGALEDAFVAASEHFAFRLADPARLEDPATRPFAVQYGESDFDFVARILSEEGLTYHFEHHAEAIVMVISDSDEGRSRLDPFDPIGPGKAGRQLDGIRLGRRMRPTRVRMVDYNWQKPKLDMLVKAESEGDESLAVDHYPGLYPDEPKQGQPLVNARLERLLTEARTAEITTPCRLPGAGSIFVIEHPADRYSGEYLVTRSAIRIRAKGELTSDVSLTPHSKEQGVAEDDERPFLATLECVRRGTADAASESKYRPALLPKPRILGSQTATVVAEPSNPDVEVHVGGPEGNENGCVRLRFHWDLEEERLKKEPASCWVRVSQIFAGAGGGSVHHPRVGTEVIVEFLDGDPDRPIVVGRVYNGIQPPAALGKGAATLSTMKSMATPKGKVWNELQFDDTEGKEKVNLTAGKDWNTAVGNNREETVKNNSNSTVQANRTENTTADRTTSVGGSNKESVDGSESITVSGDQELTVGGSQKIGVGGDRELSVGGSHVVSIGASESYSVAAGQDVVVGASKAETIGASFDLTVGAAMTVAVAGPHTRSSPIDTTNTQVHAINSITTAINAAAKAAVHAALIEIIASGSATLQGATVEVTAAGDVTISGASVSIKGGTVSIEGGSVKIAGGSTDITGSVVKVN